MKLIVDSHTHLFPKSLDPVLEKVAIGPLGPVANRRWIDQARQRMRRAGRLWMKPWSRALHKLQPMTRLIPQSLRAGLDELGGLVSLPHLLVEATAADLDEALEASHVSKALIIAHPPYSDNEFIMREAIKNPNLIPVVNFSGQEGESPEEIASKLKALVDRGARALKIHPAADGAGPDSPLYLALLEQAKALQIPVIIHTGCLHMRALFKNPKMGHAEHFTPWFETFPSVQFVLAHMNYHEPRIAIALAQRFPNVWLETSWQPAEVIGQAVNTVGAERVLFGSDWPLGGENITVGLRRIEECVEMNWITEEQSSLILGRNALQLFKLSSKSERP
jgi:predicted TIM-barrel fold metal-dependent hydrolase